MKNKPNRSETEAKINAHAWKDPSFKKKLLSDPRAALKDFGMNNIPPDVQIKVVEEEKNEWQIILKPEPANVQHLSEEELCKLQAGKCTSGCHVVPTHHHCFEV